LTKPNLNKLTSFHHSVIRWILGIKWNQVRERHIKRTATYIQKVTRLDNNCYPKKFLTAWIHGSRKNGAPQLTCNNNFATSIQKILPINKALSNNQAALCKWIHLAKDETNWNFFIDNYFEKCRDTDYEDPADDD
jgi:hypothetical protein